MPTQSGVAAAQDFDVLVSDIGLPDGSGVDLIRQLRHERPIFGIALTGFGMEEDIRRSHQGGFEYHLIKPVGPQPAGYFDPEVFGAVCWFCGRAKELKLTSPGLFVPERDLLFVAVPE